MDACKEMFDLPAEENAEYMNPTLMAPVSLGTSLNSAYWRNYVKFFTHPDFHCPEKPANLRHAKTSHLFFLQLFRNKLMHFFSLD
jgi:hypothetical protein